MGGLLGYGQGQQNSALKGLGSAASMESSREGSEKQMDEADKSGQMSMTASGAAIGTMIAPGWGTVIGAGIGFIAGELL